MITALAGGVGAARFLQGLIKLVPEENLNVIVNTGDDIELYGLHISPDLDTVMYTLAGKVDEEKGWGVENDTYYCLQMLQRYGYDTWFKLGDKDLATHIFRTSLLSEGLNLSQVTERLSHVYKLKVKIIPMTNEKFTTIIITDKGRMHFQEYIVKREAKDRVLKVEFKGEEKAQPTPGIVELILKSEAIIVCPSNPIVSIGPILRLPGIKEALKKTKANVAAVSPIVDGLPIKGPADKLMRGLRVEVSAYGVASLYREFIDAFIIDQIDKLQQPRIEKLGINVAVTNTIMKTLKDKTQLAKQVMNLVKNH